ncbi:dehydrogenase [Mesotoga sp. Brook.08.105.5.1]
MSERLTGKTALIFGTGRVGGSAARAFVNEGAKVIILDRDEDKLETLKEELEQTKRGFCSTICANIDNQKDVDEISNLIEENTWKVDILLNCPAYIFRAPFLNHPIDEIDRQWHINVRIVFMVSQAVAKMMAKNGGGKIINLASVGGLFPEREHAGHCAAKAGIIAISRVMALELASLNIQVNVIAPGPTETIPFSSPFYSQHPEVLKRIEERTPAGRIGHPEDHTGLMVFLASEESNWITGQVILSDGGLGLV